MVQSRWAPFAHCKASIVAGFEQVCWQGLGKGCILESVTKSHATQHNQISFQKIRCAIHYANDCKCNCIFVFFALCSPTAQLLIMARFV
jgi:uncharacterized cysteine cluster protein YcgN (CxxCxxCC family)